MPARGGASAGVAAVDGVGAGDRGEDDGGAGGVGKGRLRGEASERDASGEKGEEREEKKVSNARLGRSSNRPLRSALRSSRRRGRASEQKNEKARVLTRNYKQVYRDWNPVSSAAPKSDQEKGKLTRRNPLSNNSHTPPYDPSSHNNVPHNSTSSHKPSHTDALPKDLPPSATRLLLLLLLHGAWKIWSAKPPGRKAGSKRGYTGDDRKSSSLCRPSRTGTRPPLPAPPSIPDWS